MLPRGVFDLAADVPARDVTLLSPTASLLARDTPHPALAYLLLRIATEVHGNAGMLAHAGEFPAPREAGFPLSNVARRYYQAGVPFLQRYLPFWAANLVDRLWVILVPIIAVLVPLGRAVRTSTSSGSTSTWSAGASPGGCRPNPRLRALPPLRCALRRAAGSVSAPSVTEAR